MTTAPGKPAPQPDTRTKVEQVDRVVKAIELRQENLARAAAIIRTLSTLKRKV